MDWNKQSYLEVSEIKQRLDSKNKDTLSSSLLILKVDKQCAKVDFITTGRRLTVIIESDSVQDILVKLDDCIIAYDRNKYVTATDNIKAGKHRLDVECELDEPIKITVIAEQIKEVDKHYEIECYDKVNQILYVKDRDYVSYRIDLSKTKPYLELNYSIPTSSIMYLIADNNYTVSAYIDNGVLQINDNGNIISIQSDVSSCCVVEALNDNYYYQIFYIYQNTVYMIYKDSSGYSAPMNIGIEQIDRLYSLGDRAYIYKTKNGGWQAMELGLYQSVITYTTKLLNSIYQPAIRLNVDQFHYYIRNNGRYNQVIDNTVTPYCNASTLVFVGENELMMWSDRARLIKGGN